jgi:uncharacterized damage-inducible protein DinB
MTAATKLLVDALDRVREEVHSVVDGLDRTALTQRIAPEANTIGWLVWHLTRVEDDHIAGVAGRDQVWHDGWYERFGLPFGRDEHGYGHTPAQVGAVDVDGELLAGYQDAVHARAADFVRTLSDEDLDRVVDERWDPPVTMAVRLVSVVNDCTQHIGQAAFVRGVVERSRG